MKKIIVEVGSTNTKIDECDISGIKRLAEITIRFKRNYERNNALSQSDIETLIDIILKLKKSYDDIYVCGTSIFRNLPHKEKRRFLKYFSQKTGTSFNIISQEKENELTVLSATRFVDESVCVFVGGGGSTEISFFDHGIKKYAGSAFGSTDLMNKFPDLANDIASTPLESVLDYVNTKVNVPDITAKIMVLAGGGHETFARGSGIRYKTNTLYNDSAAPIMMGIETRIEDTKEYFAKTSLNEVRKRAQNPEWRFSTRAMSAIVLAVAEKVGTKYIVPTNISMAYGLFMGISNNSMTTDKLLLQ